MATAPWSSLRERLPRRDAVDVRIVRETQDGTGRIIKWVKDAGGWPEFPSATSLFRSAK